MKFGKWHKLNFKVGGDIVKVMQGAQDEETKFLEKLDSKFNRLNRVFNCLIDIDKSVYPNWEKHLTIDLQCSGICIEKDFCKKVRKAMEVVLANEMELKTSISAGGFVDYSR
jgi:hypothetical protein